MCYIYQKHFVVFIIIFILVAVGLVFAVRQSPQGNISASQTIPATGTIEVAFSPRGGITDMIVKELNGAKKSIEVQAYSFNCKALVNAFKRGVLVRIILDRSQQTQKYSSATFLNNYGVPVHIDRGFQIAHSKIMIVDRKDFITGSFNFTKAAEQSNSELSYRLTLFKNSFSLFQCV